MDELPSLIFLLILSGFFSGAEIALFSLGKEKIHALKKKINKKSEQRRITRLELLTSDPQKLLVTILIGNNIVNIAASALATIIATNLAVEHGFGENKGAVIGLVTGIMTFLILLFGEITPKAFAHKYALKFALFIAPILVILQFLLFPIVVPLAKLVKKFSGTTEHKHGMNEAELKAMIEISEKEGSIEYEEKELVEKALEFDTHLVETIMTPRSKIFTLNEELGIKESLEEISKAKFSKIPIFKEKKDEKNNLILDFSGILTIQMLIEFFSKTKKIDNKKIKDLDLPEPFKIPSTMKIDTLLKEFKKRKTKVALVLDEYGDLVGLITLEDVIEEVFGEIDDEGDDMAFIWKIGKNKFVCDSDIELEQIEKFLHEKLKEKDIIFPWNLEDENKTLGYFLLKKFERFPKINETIVVENNMVKFIFSIKKMEQETIKKVEFSLFFKKSVHLEKK